MITYQPSISMSKKLCAISLSGGMDSFVTMIHALNSGYDILPITFNYGQRHQVEMRSAKKLMKWTKHWNSTIGPKQEIHDWVSIDLKNILSPMNYTNLRDKNIIRDKTGLKFYTPSRNLVFGSVVTMLSEFFVISASTQAYKTVSIGFGLHKNAENTTYATDYWDTTNSFTDAFNNILALNKSSEIEFNIYSPFVGSTKSDIVDYAIEHNLPIEKTWSCYSPQLVKKKKKKSRHKTKYKPCLVCEACMERQIALDLSTRPR